MLRLLMGALSYEGSLTTDVPFTIFPPPLPEPEAVTRSLMERIAPQLEEWERLRELSYLQVAEHVLDRPFSTLSPGEQTKVLLATCFLEYARYPLLDEPTNHLDAAARQVVTEYLARKEGYAMQACGRIEAIGATKPPK